MPNLAQPRILLGLTGSVATILAKKIVPALQEIGEVKVVMTEAAKRFEDPFNIHNNYSVDVFTDLHEWSFVHGNVVSENETTPILHRVSESAWGWATNKSKSIANGLYEKGQPILHIDLREWADIIVIAPLSANTLAKMALGLCDNLLTSVYRAWEHRKPLVVAPAMNTEMWNNSPTSDHIMILRERNKKRELPGDSHHPWEMPSEVHIVEPMNKTLACNIEGKGAMARIEDVVQTTIDAMRWLTPIRDKDFGGSTLCPGIPREHHPGSFAFKRKHDTHTGVDLYVDEKTPVRAVEPGIVIGVMPFTGPQLGQEFSFWLDTDIVLVEGASGIVGYGEISPNVKMGQRLDRGALVGFVKSVLPPDRLRKDIPGHKTSMLHLELRKRGMVNWEKWDIGTDNPGYIDPTPFLGNAHKAMGWID